MNRRQFAVLGLGKFGKNVAMTLANAGYEVIAVDDDEERINEIADHVTYAIRADVTEQGVLENIGIKNVDAVVVAMALDLGTSVMATIRAKEVGAKYVVAKASDTMHGNILKKVGADEVVYPEKQLAAWTAIRCSSDHVLDYIELDGEHSIFEISVPSEWCGKTIVQLDLRKKYGINVLGIMDHGNLDMHITPDLVLTKEKSILVLGKQKVILKCFHI